MTKFLVLTTALIFFANAAFCEGLDDWDDYIKIDEAAKSQQKTVTKDEFEKVMQQFEKKNKKKEKSKIKGESRTPEDEAFGNVQIFKELYETYPTILVPTDLITTDGQEIPTGFYKIMSVKKPNGYFMNFYQGNSLIARVKSDITQNDYNQKTLNYAKMIDNDENSVKFIYGDIDCNLESLIYIKK